MRRSAGINTAFRAIKAEHASNRSPMEVLADRMIGVASATPFLVVHAFLFIAWIYWNLPFSGLPKFDPYPYGMLTLVVSPGLLGQALAQASAFSGHAFEADAEAPYGSVILAGERPDWPHLRELGAVR